MLGYVQNALTTSTVVDGNRKENKMATLKERLTELSNNLLNDLEKKPLKTVLWAVLIAYIVVRIVKAIKE